MSLHPMEARRQGGSPFEPAPVTDRRLKALFWGDSGAGKTTLALRFPHPAVIDLEGGTVHYGGQFDFEVLKATTADEVMAAVDWLLTHEHPYRTLVIDPITIHWDALQAKWSQIFLQRNKGGKGHHGEYYELQPRDWVTMKAEFKLLVRKLLQLDMNVIVTARQKALYSDSGFMRVIGETFDGEKSLPYRVVYLVSTAVGEVLTLEVDLCPLEFLGQSFRKIEGCGPSHVISQIRFQFLLEAGVFPG